MYNNRSRIRLLTAHPPFQFNKNGCIMERGNKSMLKNVISPKKITSDETFRKKIVPLQEPRGTPAGIP